MSQRKPTQHELDCALVRSVLNAAPTLKPEALDAFVRIVRRSTRTSVRGKDYILHIQDAGDVLGVYCGRYRDKVNSVTLKDAKDLDSEQWCKRCVARIKKEQTLP